MKLLYKILPFFIFIFLNCDYFDPLSFFGTINIDNRFDERNDLKDFSPPSLSDTTSFSFITISDTHYYKEQLNYIKEIDSKKNDYNIDFIIVNGDIVQSGLKYQFELASNDFKQTSIPVYPVIGNHDIYNNGFQNYKELFGRTIYDFKLDKLHIIILDTANGTLGDKQLEYLENLLKYSGLPNKIVFTHYNLLEKESQSATSYSYPEETYKIFNMFEKYGVDFCVSGHIHIFDIKEIRGTKYISLNNISDKENSYIIFRYNNGKISYEIF